MVVKACALLFGKRSSNGGGLFHFKPSVPCPLLAQSGHADLRQSRQLSGAKRTSQFDFVAAVNDPSGTSPAPAKCQKQTKCVLIYSITLSALTKIDMGTMTPTRDGASLLVITNFYN